MINVNKETKRESEAAQSAEPYSLPLPGHAVLLNGYDQTTEGSGLGRQGSVFRS